MNLACAMIEQASYGIITGVNHEVRLCRGGHTRSFAGWRIQRAATTSPSSTATTGTIPGRDRAPELGSRRGPYANGEFHRANGYCPALKGSLLHDGTAGAELNQIDNQVCWCDRRDILRGHIYNHAIQHPVRGSLARASGRNSACWRLPRNAQPHSHPRDKGLRARYLLSARLRGVLYAVSPGKLAGLGPALPIFPGHHGTRFRPVAYRALPAPFPFPLTSTSGLRQLRHCHETGVRTLSRQLLAGAVSRVGGPIIFRVAHDMSKTWLKSRVQRRARLFLQQLLNTRRASVLHMQETRQMASNTIITLNSPSGRLEGFPDAGHSWFQG